MISLTVGYVEWKTFQRGSPIAHCPVIMRIMGLETITRGSRRVYGLLCRSSEDWSVRGKRFGRFQGAVKRFKGGSREEIPRRQWNPNKTSKLLPGIPSEVPSNERNNSRTLSIVHELLQTFFYDFFRNPTVISSDILREILPKVMQGCI